MGELNATKRHVQFVKAGKNGDHLLTKLVNNWYTTYSFFKLHLFLKFGCPNQSRRAVPLRETERILISVTGECVMVCAGREVSTRKSLTKVLEFCVTLRKVDEMTRF